MWELLIRKIYYSNLVRYEKADFKDEWISTTWLAFWLFLGSLSLLYMNILAVMTFIFQDWKKIYLTNRRIIYVPLRKWKRSQTTWLFREPACRLRHSTNGWMCRCNVLRFRLFCSPLSWKCFFSVYHAIDNFNIWL